MKIEDVGLKFPNSLTPLKRVEKVIVHHPAHQTWNIHDIHNFHIKSRSFNGIGYNYFVTQDGRVQKGRGRNQGAQTLGWNDKSLGVCFQGNFEIQTPSEVQYRAGAELIAQLILDEGLNIHDVDGHKVFDRTVCPGKNFDLNKLRNYILEVVNPNVKVEPAPKQEVKSKVVKNPSKSSYSGNSYIKAFQKWLNSNYNAGLVVDGTYGPKTKSAAIKALQTEFNKQFSAKLVVDGKWGPKTKSAIRTVRKGAKGNITRIIQGMLYCLGYDPKGFDGDFGNGSDEAVRELQDDKNLNIDGVVGKNTFAKMF